MGDGIVKCKGCEEEFCECCAESIDYCSHECKELYEAENSSTS